MPARLPPILPDQLTPEQRLLYDRNREQIAHGFTAFTTTRDDGALLGPWGVFLHEPAVGQAHYDQIAAVTALKRLPEPAKQVAILVVGARYRAAYELYAHAATATSEGMDAAKVATIAVGAQPTSAGTRRPPMTWRARCSPAGCFPARAIAPRATGSGKAA